MTKRAGAIVGTRLAKHRKTRRMNAARALALLLSALAFAAAAAGNFDRLRAGQWEVTVSANGKSAVHSACVAPAVADAINGDLASVRGHAQAKAAPGCTVTDVKVNGAQVIVVSRCAGGETVAKTTYRGDSWDAADSEGTRTRARRTGECRRAPAD
jgi:hypothetical protein